MSIFNDRRRYSDDPDEYNEWKAEVAWECRRENAEPEDQEEEEGEDE